MDPTPPRPLRRGWCPALDQPMASGDGLLVRVTPPGATMTAEQARALAAASDRFGNGRMELTQRGNIQVRGLADAAGFAAAVRAAGLALPPAMEARRRVMPPPLLGADPALPPAAAALTAALERACQTDPRLAALPAKFAIHVEAGGVLGARPASATLVVRPDGTVGAGGRSGTLAGPLDYDGRSRAMALGAPFGQFDADGLRQLAGLAAAYGTTLRTTPWRAMLLACVPSAAVLAPPGWIVAADDPRLRVATCIGAPGCLRATTPTRNHAAQLAARLPPGESMVHLSGCPKGCAHPAPAPTLVARDGAYDVVGPGRAGDAPRRTGLDLPAAIAALLA